MTLIPTSRQGWLNPVRILFLAFLGVCAWQATHLELETRIVEFLPEGNVREQISLSGLASATGFARGMILALAAPTDLSDDEVVRSSVEFSDQFALDLRSSGLFKSVSNGIDASYADEFFRIYFPRRFGFLSEHPEREISTLLAKDELDETLLDLKRRLLLPDSHWIKRIAGRDPFLVFPSLTERMRAEVAKVSPRVVNGHFFSSDLQHQILFVETLAEPFDIPSQKKNIRYIKERFEEMNSESGGGFRLSFTGLNRFSVESEKRIRGDIVWASTASTVAVVALFLIVYRRFRFLVLAFLPVGVGILAALGVSTMLFTKVHGLALAFGSTLIGVSIDYPIHLLNHMMLGGQTSLEDKKRSRIHLLRALLVGVTTTLGGFLVLALSSYPGFRQIAIYTIVGASASFLFSILFLPLAAPWIGQQTRGISAFGRILSNRIRIRNLGRTWTIAFAILAVSIGFGISRLELEDDVRALDQVDPDTQQEDETIRSYLPSSGFPLYLLVPGSDLEEALDRNDRLFLRLQQLKRDGRIREFFSIHPMLPSKDIQERNLRALAAQEGLEGQLAKALKQAGFRPEAFAEFSVTIQDVRDGKVDVVTPELFPDSPLGDLIHGFTFEHDGRHWALTLVNPVSEGDTLDDVRLFNGDLVRFNRAVLVSSILSSTQKETVVLVLAGVLLNAILLFVWLRKARLVIRVLLPTVLALLLVVGGTAWLGARLNVLHVMSLLLILCMGVDYAVFLVCGRHDTASVSILLSALTTALTYGALALCKSPALVSIGTMVTTGILLVCLLTFLSAARQREDVNTETVSSENGGPQ